MTDIRSLKDVDSRRFETPTILKKLKSAARNLAEFKGVTATIPNQRILINTLGIQEAKDSSEIENIVTTHDEIFQDSLEIGSGNHAAKEVSNYRQALQVGFTAIRRLGLLTVNDICEIQAALVCNQAGLRTLPGTTLKNQFGETIYTPPQDYNDIRFLMSDLERFINNGDAYDSDAIIKMALMHHQFESIHPFYDGNGRTGRILNVLYLTKEGLLGIPVLYLSRYIVRTKNEYYRLLQEVRINDAWEDWVLYMLAGVEKTSADGIEIISKIKEAFQEAKHGIREKCRFYSQDLINNLFNHPYTKITYIQKDLNVNRSTAAKYLEKLVEEGFLVKRKIRTSNYYINQKLVSILTAQG